jgi:hypothetical protein
VKFEELLAQAKTPEVGDDILSGMQLILTADDLTENDKSGFATGFLMGLTYGLAKSNEGDIPGAARTLLRLQNEWEANGVI